MSEQFWKMEWNDGMSVGIPEIDAEHQQFIFLINQFNHAIADRLELQVIKQRLQNIRDDAVHHFAHEERLFEQWHYPDTEYHVNRHKEALKALQETEREFINYNLEPEWIAAGLAVKNILIIHILIEDRKYADFHRKSSMSPAGIYRPNTPCKQ